LSSNLKAHFYGFRLGCIEAVPVQHLIGALQEFDKKEFRHGGKNRRAFVSYDETVGEVLVTLVTESIQRPLVVEDHSADEIVATDAAQADKPIYSVVPPEQLPKGREVCCILFSKRRSTGVVATYRGSFSITQVCGWIEKTYREVVKRHREAELSQASTRQHAEIKRSYPLIHCGSCNPIAKSRGKLQQELKEIERFGSIEVYVQEQSKDLAAMLTMDTKSLKMKVVFKEENQSPGLAKRVWKFIRRRKATRGEVIGVARDGSPRKVLLNQERAFSLGSISYTELIEVDHINNDDPGSAAIFHRLRKFMDDNPQLFGS